MAKLKFQMLAKLPTVERIKPRPHEVLGLKLVPDASPAGPSRTQAAISEAANGANPEVAA